MYRCLDSIHADPQASRMAFSFIAEKSGHNRRLFQGSLIPQIFFVKLLIARLIPMKLSRSLTYFQNRR